MTGSRLPDRVPPCREPLSRCVQPFGWRRAFCGIFQDTANFELRFLVEYRFIRTGRVDGRSHFGYIDA